MYSKHQSGARQKPCIKGKNVFTGTRIFKKQHDLFVGGLPSQIKPQEQKEQIQQSESFMNDSFNLSFSEASINDIQIGSPLKGGNFNHYGPKIEDVGGAQQKELDSEAQDVIDYDAIDQIGVSEYQSEQEKIFAERKKTTASQFDLQNESANKKPSTYKAIVNFVPKSNFHSQNRKITLADLKKDIKKSKLASGNSSGSAFLDQSTLATGGNISADKTAESGPSKSIKVQKTENKKRTKEPLKIKIDKVVRPKSNQKAPTLGMLAKIMKRSEVCYVDGKKQQHVKGTISIKYHNPQLLSRNKSYGIGSQEKSEEYTDNSQKFFTSKEDMEQKQMSDLKSYESTSQKSQITCLSQLNNRRRQTSPDSNVASYVSSKVLTGAESIMTMKSTMLKSSSINMVQQAENMVYSDQLSELSAASPNFSLPKANSFAHRKQNSFNSPHILSKNFLKHAANKNQMSSFARPLRSPMCRMETQQGKTRTRLITSVLQTPINSTQQTPINSNQQTPTHGMSFLKRVSYSHISTQL